MILFAYISEDNSIFHKALEKFFGGEREEHFYNQALDRRRDEGRSETLNATIDFMRSNGMTNDQVNDSKKSVLKN